jgi:Flp pilus assembly pilin Flp
MSYLKNKKGQGLVEYILIVVLMGILAIGVLKTLGKTTRNGFTQASDKLSSAFDGN